MPWTLPSGTKIIGAGVGITTLASSVVSPLINMGSSNLCSISSPCTGIGVQDLSLTQTASSSTPIAIDNEFGGDLSYVQRVTISVSTVNPGTGLRIGQYAQNSGPYLDIEISGQGGGSSPGTACVWVKQPATGIRIRGLNCTGNFNFGAAVILDGSNNSIEDVYISNAYTEGILVGADNSVSNDVLLNITGGYTNTVHVCGPNGGTGACNGKSYAVTDLSLLGVERGTATNSINDEVTATTLSDTQVEMYILGEGVNVATGTMGYARFTTSPSTATWGVNTSAPNGNCSSATKGSLFSNINGNHSNGDAFWVCTASGWMGVY